MKYPIESPKKAGAWLYDKGANVLSLDGKNPSPLTWKKNGWQDNRQDVEAVKKMPWHRDGVGVICGIGGVRCFDIDGTEEEGVKFGAVQKVLDVWSFPHTYPWIVTSGSGNGFHVWFRCEDDDRFDPRTNFEPRRDGAFDHLELRWENHQTAVPPTVHPETGMEYEFYRKRPEKAPWEVSPDEVEEAIRKVARPKGSSSSTTKSLDVPETIQDGQRNNTLTSVAGTLRNRGFAAKEMEQMLQMVNENRCSPPLDEEEVQKIAQSVERYEPSDPITNGEADGDDSGPWDKIRATYQDDKKQARLFSADQLESDLDVATHRRSGHLYVWDSEGKIYADDGEQSIRSRLMEKLQSDFSQHEVREIIGMLKAKTYRSKFGAEGFIPVANGDLKVTADNVELKDATPERGFRTRSPAKWDPEADAPIFRTYLEQVVQTEDERRTLQEYAGYSLMYWGLPYHKALFLVGPQASGKSTFLKVLQEMLGKTTQLSPQQLVDDDFGAIELEDSWANLASDIPSELLSNVGRFKEITAGDRIFAERKYEQGYTVEPTAKHFYSANQLPEIKIDDNAFFRRVMIVAFPETIDREQRDPELPEKLELELDGILHWAANGLQRLMQNEGFTRDLKPEETRRVWDEHASSIGQFKIRRLKVTGHSQDVEAKQDVYRTYTEFCMDNGLPTESQQKLTRVLKRDPRIGQAKRTPEGWEKQAKCYVGVQIPTEDRDEEPGNEAPF